MYDIETQSGYNYWENSTNRLALYRVTTNLQFVKKKQPTNISAKCNKAKHNKMRYACITKMILLAGGPIVETQSQKGYYSTFHDCTHTSEFLFQYKLRAS